MRYLFLIAIISFWSCKKDKLKGEKEVLEGRWSWNHSIVTHESCGGPPTYEETITPLTNNIDYTVDFNKKGCVTLYENETKKEKNRIVFNSWFNATNLPEYYSFSISMDNKDEKRMYGYVNNDTLILNGSYFPFENGSCTYYLSYFVKE